MHKPDPDLPPNAQDKRSVISVEQRDVKLWLEGELSDILGLLVPPAPAQLAF